MSDIQSSITDRFPKKANRTSSILSKDHPPDKKPKSDKTTIPSTHEFDPTELQPLQRRASVVTEARPASCGLVQRCVIIQKDENGFGLTVSGDNPVFVQLVKEDGAAMRAGVQTGDRIIKVNGTLVTHSNHVEVVKLIKSGSYVALTVLGRPPGLPQIPLSEVEVDVRGVGSPSPSSPSSPGRPYGPVDRLASPLPAWEENNTVISQRVDMLQKMLSKEQRELQGMKEEYSRNPSPKLLMEIQGATQHIPQLQGQLRRVSGGAPDGLHYGDGEDSSVGEVDRHSTTRGDLGPDSFLPRGPAAPVPNAFGPGALDGLGHREPYSQSPAGTPRDGFNSSPFLEAEDSLDPNVHPHSSAGTPPPRTPRAAAHIIGAEDDDFNAEQDQVNGQCSCFQSMELLKARPAHLAAFLHHVVSQFDPAPLLCYLYADLYKQTNSKETRRVFMDLLTFFIDRGANLRVAVPDSVSSELERRRPELIPEELHRQYVQLLQEAVLPDVQRNLDDFRQKRSMGLTLAEGELSRLDTEQLRDGVALERERTCAENIISKIEDVLLTSQPTEEEKCTTMQYVIFTYMKLLGVRVKEQASKRMRMNFLRIKKSSKTEKEGEEKVKKTRFPSILGRPIRMETPSIGVNKQRPPKQLSQPALGVSEPVDVGRLRGSQSSEGSELIQSPALASSPSYSAPYSHSSDPTNRDDIGAAVLSRLAEGSHATDAADGLFSSPSSQSDFSPFGPEQPEYERESDRLEGAEVQSEDDQGGEIHSDFHHPNWQQLVGREVLAGLTPHEIKRQEVINELFNTERAHMCMLKVLDNIFYQKLSRDNILPPTDIKNIFTNLEEIVQLHATISEQMASIRKRNDTSVIDQIGDDVLSWFSGAEEEKIRRAVATFCSNQPFALELLKSRQKKDQRFISFMQEAESNRQCRRLQLKDILPAEMQRFTKYPLLLDNVAKYTDDAEDRGKVQRAAECCRKILHHVNQAVKESENKQRLEDYQRRLDLSSLKQSENPMIAEFKNLDLTKRKMVHEGPLSWKVNKDKTIELYTLLLEDILVLLQRQDERLVLKCHLKNLVGTADTKHIFSPIIKLSTVLVRSVATDNKSFFVLSMSDNGAQIYELMAQTVSEQGMWQRQITQRADAMKAKPHNVIALPDEDRGSAEIGSKLGKASDRISTGSVQSSPGALQSPSPREGLKPEGEEEEEERGREEGPYPDSPLLDGRDADSPSPSGGSKAEEALKTLAALKQVLVTQLMAQDDGERASRPAGGRLLRTASLRTPVESCSGRTPTTRDSRAQDLASGDTGFFECSEDYAAYLVLEGYRGSGESSTDDEVAVVGEDLGMARGCAADSGISLKFSSPSSGSTSRLSRQVLTYLRSLQASLNQLKEVETKYNNLLRQRQAGSTADTEESKASYRK